MKSETRIGMMCLCNKIITSRWTRQTNFARIWVCSARGQIGQGNIRIHDRQRRRYRCRRCNKTLSAQRGTMMEGLRKLTELIIIVVTLLAYGCPIQAIVQAFGLDERTVTTWRDRAGQHGNVNCAKLKLQTLL